MRHTISLLVENEYGMLSRVAGLFSARGYQIDTLCVGPTLEEDISRMTLTTHGNDQIIEQIIKQLRKLVKVIKVTDLTERAHVEREMAMLTINAEMGEHRHELHGAVAFAAWLGVHAWLMSGVRQRVDAFISWAWDYHGKGRAPQILDRSDAAHIDWGDDDA